MYEPRIECKKNPGKNCKWAVHFLQDADILRVWECTECGRKLQERCVFTEQYDALFDTVVKVWTGQFIEMPVENG